MPTYSLENLNDQLAVFNSIREDYLYNFSLELNKPLIGPRTLQLSLTTQCNLKCLMCDAWKLNEREIEGFYFKKIIDDTFKMGNLKEVIYSGGEALLRPEAFNLIKYVKDYYPDVTTILNTNGLLLNKKNIDNLINVKLNILSVSIDSPVAQINNGLRGSGVLEKAIEAIDYLNAEKKRRNAQYPVLGICSVLMDQTLDTMYDMLDFCASHNMAFIVIQAYVPNVNMALSKKEDRFWIHKERLPRLRDVLQRIEGQKERMPGLHIEVPSEKIYNYFTESMPFFKCYAGYTQVLLVGRVMQFVCCGPQHEEKYKYLDTVDEDPVNELWFSEKADYIRGTIKTCKRNCAQFCTIRPSSDSAAEIHKRLAGQKNLFLIFRELHLLSEYLRQYPGLHLNELVDADYALIKENLDAFLGSVQDLNSGGHTQGQREYLLSDLKLLEGYLKNTDKAAYSLFQESCCGILQSQGDQIAK